MHLRRPERRVTEISSTLAAILASNFENRVVCDGPSDGSCSCVYITHISKIWNHFFFLGENCSLRGIQALSYLKYRPRCSHMPPTAIRVCVAACTSVVYGPFFCTFAHFPAPFPSQFVLLSIFLIIHGDLTCFQRAHGQAADHQGGKAPK